MKKKNRAFLVIGIILSIIFTMSFIAIYEGRFLFSPEIDNNPKKSKVIKPINLVEHKKISTIINGNKQVINILEIDLSNPKVNVKPVLSFDLIYGYETLSAMVSRHKAYAAVNSGFFNEYGFPGGMVGINGDLITGSSGKYPVFVVTGRNAMLMELKNNFYINISGKRTKIDGINKKGTQGSIIVYNSWYGTTNRASSNNYTAVVENGAITKIIQSEDETAIPSDGMLITVYVPGDKELILPMKEGEEAKFSYEPYMGEGFQAYECGSWILRNGKNVAPLKDPWVGVLTNRDPRTVVGLKSNTSIVLMTVDGRQPGYSAGLTAKELGEFLLGYGVKDAAMLDGGASTEMIVKGEIVNRPSFKGEERPLGGALIVTQN